MLVLAITWQSPANISNTFTFSTGFSQSKTTFCGKFDYFIFFLLFKDDYWDINSAADLLSTLEILSNSDSEIPPIYPWLLLPHVYTSPVSVNAAEKTAPHFIYFIFKILKFCLLLLLIS